MHLRNQGYINSWTERVVVFVLIVSSFVLSFCKSTHVLLSSSKEPDLPTDIFFEIDKWMSMGYSWSTTPTTSHDNHHHLFKQTHKLRLVSPAYAVASRRSLFLSNSFAIFRQAAKRGDVIVLQSIYNSFPQSKYPDVIGNMILAKNSSAFTLAAVYGHIDAMRLIHDWSQQYVNKMIFFASFSFSLINYHF